MRGIRFIPEGTKVDFIGRRYLAFVFTFIVMAGTIFLCFTKGLNFGIDFTGGTVMEIRTEQAPDMGVLREELNGLGLGDVSLQQFGEGNDVMIRLPQQDGGEDAQAAAIGKVHGSLDEKFGEGKVEYRRTEYVGPQVGDELKKTAMWAVIWSLIGILGYVWFRFEWQFGVATIAALIHDVVATIGLFAVTQMQFDLSTLAAVLLIAGYSTNDSVVIFDRVRENMRKYKKMAIEDILNVSVNQTLSRTILTGGTTIIALVALWLFGGEVIRSFTNALIFGVLIGTFSSIYVGSPLVMYLNLRRPKDDAEQAQPQPGQA